MITVIVGFFCIASKEILSGDICGFRRKAPLSYPEIQVNLNLPDNDDVQGLSLLLIDLSFF